MIESYSWEQLALDHGSYIRTCQGIQHALLSFENLGSVTNLRYWRLYKLDFLTSASFLYCTRNKIWNTQI